ncbi:MAG: DNA-binding protein Alba [Candidatus Thermoplasmatota archaeon]|jgi:DNA-binding protein|nr:DNA-binding protein Alba [Candidatus Thermoplasmatota archaeon]
MRESGGQPSGQQEATVYIGTKPVMTYVFEVISQLSSGLSDVKIKARGNSISHAVDVAEVARRHKILEGKVQLKSVSIGTERLTNRAGRDTNVSTIEIVLSKTGEMAPPASPSA